MKAVTEKANFDKTLKGGERGSAIVIALLVLALMSVFVAFALSRSSVEAMAVGNETSEARTFYAAQGSIESMTRNFNKTFEVKLNPTTTDLDSVRDNLPPGITGFQFGQERPVQISDRQVVVLTGGPYSGLNAIRDSWRLRSTVTDDSNGTQIQLTRNVLNNRIPIFQFGIFYDDDLELFRPPLFSFGGRVHSNRHFFVSPGSEGIYFNSRVTAAGHIITQTWRNWYTGDSANAQTWIKNASAVDRQLLPSQGSVLNTTAGAADNIFAGQPDLPPSRINTSFPTQSAIFDGNLQSQVPQLRLPLKVGNSSLIEMVKRGKRTPDANGGDLNNEGGALVPVSAGANDNEIMKAERFANKTGIRISLADSKAKLPGCASGTGIAPVATPCGVRLDGDITGTGSIPSPTPSATPERARGYQPKLMRSTAGGAFNYNPTRVNGERLYTGGTREVWIKVETVTTEASTGNIITVDITQDFLALGMTEQPSATSGINIHTGLYDENPITSSITATTPQSVTGGNDSRSVIKIQRWTIPGPFIPGGSNMKTSYGAGASAMNTVVRYTTVGTDDTNILTGCATVCVGANVDPNFSNEHLGHLKRATVNGTNDVAIVPFPIKMFDSREGEHFDNASNTYYTNLNNVTRNGIMSMIDIDVANMRRFFRGDFNGLFPIDTPFAISKGGVGLVNSDIPEKQGWVVYVSDRRGDADFDGQFDMEDVYGANLGNDDTLQAPEDVNGNNLLDVAYGSEAERYNTNTILPDVAAVNDHMYYRRGVRLINGETIPGVYDSATPSNTRGFTVSSENGIYVRGNYNSTGVTSVPATGNTPYNNFLPFDTNTHIPASVVADAVTILSNSWNDAQSFSSPYNQANRLASATTMRFAMLSGDTISSRDQTPNQGGISPRLNGGVHNFKRFLERWTGVNFSYAGSLINLFYSQNNNGSFKCCNTVYNPPRRNWVFDSTFLQPDRIPPGTPFFQYVQTTGFLRTNN